jgi:hypothetical protein
MRASPDIAPEKQAAAPSECRSPNVQLLDTDPRRPRARRPAQPLSAARQAFEAHNATVAPSPVGRPCGGYMLGGGTFGGFMLGSGN